MIKTDNRMEITDVLLVTKSKQKALFEQALLDMGTILNIVYTNHARIAVQTAIHRT
jgi:hypothetical protein